MHALRRLSSQRSKLLELSISAVENWQHAKQLLPADGAAHIFRASSNAVANEAHVRLFSLTAVSANPQDSGAEPRDFDHDLDNRFEALASTRLTDAQDGAELSIADVPSGLQQSQRGKALAGPAAAPYKMWAEQFQMKIVDVNRTSRGSPTGGIGRFAAIVVVGNGNGVIGFGTGRSLSLGDAVKKANRQALKTLFFVPRYNDSTILENIVSTYKKCKVIMYPRSSGSGFKASPLMRDICKLAGIQDIGVKVHGTGNLRNTVKALIRGFESQKVEQEELELPSSSSIAALQEAQSRKIRGVPTKQTIGLINIPRS